MDQYQRTNPLEFFVPYGKQKDFFEMGAEKRERLLQAGNQTGKSQAGSFEAACHLTGLYPSWWEGKRFNRPTQGWICGASGSSVRDICQLKLFGPVHDDTISGMVPRHLMVGKSVAHGTADLYDTVRVRHISGGISTVATKSYEQGVEKWMGSTLDWVWLDEEAPEKLYLEAIARLTGAGCIWTTFTPLAGFTQVIGRFLRDESEDARRYRGVVKMGLRDAEHFTPEEKRQRLASYAPHERAARENGDPTLGSGAIFTQLDTTLAVDANLYIPLHWAKLWAIDFGSQVFAAALIAWDRDEDVIYVLDTVRLENSRPIEHASAIKRKAPDVRIAYPHDGHLTERGSGETVISNYRPFGLQFLGTHATHPDGGISVEAGLLEMQQRMGDGRFRVRANLADWFDEYRGYHRDDKGRVVKVRDHILDATRYALMMKRYARPGPIGGAPGGGSRRPTPRLAVGVDFDLF